MPGYRATGALLLDHEKSPARERPGGAEGHEAGSDEPRTSRVDQLIAIRPALRLSEHLEGDSEAIFRHVCALGPEGIVSKRRDARYRSGRSSTWLKVKNPAYERR
jgi:hypothetical protein